MDEFELQIAFIGIVTFVISIIMLLVFSIDQWITGFPWFSWL